MSGGQQARRGSEIEKGFLEVLEVAELLIALSIICREVLQMRWEVRMAFRCLQYRRLQFFQALPVLLQAAVR